MKSRLICPGLCSVLLLYGAVSCREPVTCSQIVDAPLLSVSFDRLDRKTIAEWIKTNYSAGDLWNVKEGPVYDWRYAEKAYAAHVEPAPTAVYVSLSPQPTIAEVIQCFGKPDSYFMREIGVELSGVDLTIWYPGRGMIFSYYGFGSLSRARFTPRSSLEAVTVTKPGTLFEVARKNYSDELAKQVAASAKPWPEPFESINGSDFE